MAKIPSLKHFSKSIGPGVITGIADDDPSGIATYAQTGAMFGLGQLWLALYAIPFMVVIQEMCGRIGMLTGKGLAGVIKGHYSKWILYGAIVLLLLANTVNIGADLGAMAQAVGFIAPISFGVSLLLITAFTILSAIFIPYVMYVKVLKWLSITIGAYIISAFTVHHEWGTIFASLLTPHIEWNKTFLLNITAMLGTTISPYLFFWQASEEIEEELTHHKLRLFGRGVPKVTKHDVAQMKADTVVGMVMSNVVTFFIIITASSTLHTAGSTGISSATQIASSLEPIAGAYATILFALGILGTGLLAVPVLAGSAGYAIAEAFALPEGLGMKFLQAKGFYAIIIIATLAGALVNVLDIDTMSMLYYAAAFNGILAAPLMVIILMIANNKKILGKNTNGRWSNILGIIITILMALVSIFTVEAFLK